MRRTSMADWVASFLIRAFLTAMRITFSLLMPPLYMLAVWLTRQILEQIRPHIVLTQGWIYLLTIGGWSGTALLPLPALWAVGSPIPETLFFLLALGFLIDLSIANQLARSWISLPTELSSPDLHQLHGIHPSMVADEDEQRHMSWEELIQSGVVLGQRVRR